MSTMSMAVTSTVATQDELLSAAEIMATMATMAVIGHMVMLCAPNNFKKA